MTRRWMALGLGAALLAVAGLAAGLAAAFESRIAPSQSLDPHHRGVAAAGVFAAALCLFALWRLFAVARGAARWFDAGLWLAWAIVALLLVDAVALASRLGG